MVVLSLMVGMVLIHTISHQKIRVGGGFMMTNMLLPLDHYLVTQK